MLDNYNTIHRKASTRTPFKGNSCHAILTEDDRYLVYSYSTLIAEWQPDGERIVSDRKYSVTTSRQQNIIRRAWGLK